MFHLSWFHMCSWEPNHLRQDFLFALHWAEEEALHSHEALTDQALGAAGALEALRLSMPVVVAVGDPLSLGVHWILAGWAFLQWERNIRVGNSSLPSLKPPASHGWRTLREDSYHSVALHVARRAHRLVLLHDVRLPGEDAIAVETAEVLQMPVVALGLSVLVTEDQLRTHKHARCMLDWRFKKCSRPLEKNDSKHVSPHRSRRTAASRCLRSGVRSTACLSSRSRSCPPAALCRYSTRSRLGATACRNRPAQRRQPARPGASAARSVGTTEKRNNRKRDGREVSNFTSCSNSITLVSEHQRKIQKQCWKNFSSVTRSKTPQLLVKHIKFPLQTWVIMELKAAINHKTLYKRNK